MECRRAGKRYTLECKTKIVDLVLPRLDAQLLVADTVRMVPVRRSGWINEAVRV